MLLFWFLAVKVERGFSKPLQKIISSQKSYLFKFSVSGTCDDIPHEFVPASLHVTILILYLTN